MNLHPPAFASALLVEDDLNLSQAIELALKEMKIPTQAVTTLSQARSKVLDAPSGAPELIVLDRNLPDGDGLNLCNELRSAGYSGMILVLTAMGDTEQRVEGLEKGADEYIGKPFSWDELSARIKALSRRHSPKKDANIALWMRDSSRVRILGPKGWITLTPLEFKLASHLIASEGKIVSRDELLRQVWGFRLLPKTRTVDYFMGRLRKHFEIDPDSPRFFLTVRGAGYRFEKGTAE